MKKPTLGDIIEGWPSEVGDSLEELVLLPKEALKAILDSIDPDLAQLVVQLRAQARELMQANEREAPLGTPASVAAALRDGALRPRRGWWIAYPLDARHRRIAAPHKSGGSRFVVILRSKFPTNEDLPTIDAANGYLVIWGGPPDVLNIKGVPERIQALSDASLVDVMFWDHTTRVVHSLRFGLGETTNGKCEFPESVQTTATNLKEALWP
jgi:hypothetical protein